MAIDVHSTPRIGYEPIRRPVSRAAGGDDLDWLGLGRTLWRRKLFLLGFVVIVLGLTAAYVSRIPPAFEAEALVMLNERQAQVAPDIPEVLAGMPPNEDGLQGQLLLIKSRSMAERMVDQLNLHLLPEFNPTLRPKTADFADWLDPARLIPAAILDRLPKAWADTLMTTSSSAEMTDQQRAALLRAEIVERVMENIAAEPANRSTVIGLKFISTEPQIAALGANTLARLYLAEQLETKQTAARRAREFLEHEIERLRASVASAEQAIQDYRRQSGLGGALPDEQQLSGLTTQLVLSRSERAQAEARLRQVERLVNANPDLDQAAQLLDSPVLTELRARELELNRQRAELSNEFGERHPRMVNLRAEQDTLEQRKQAEIRQIAQRLRDEVQVLRSREATLRSQHRPLEGSAGRAQRVRDRAGGLAARRERRPRAARDLHQSSQGDRVPTEGAGAGCPRDLPRDHARRGDLSASPPDLRRRLVGRAARRLARGIRSRAARQHLPQLRADRGSDRPADARPGTGDHAVPRSATARRRTMCSTTRTRPSAKRYAACAPPCS